MVRFMEPVGESISKCIDYTSSKSNTNGKWSEISE